MVLERLISVGDALRHPWRMFIVGGIISVLCLFVSFLIFPKSVGLFTTFLITIAMTPLMIRLITYEEVSTEKEIQSHMNRNFFQRHANILTIYAAFFAGMILFLSIVFLLLPESTVQKLFEDQINEINLIRGSVLFSSTLERIVFNNIGVLVLSVVLSFLFGAGAIFILAWNASILATAIGLTAQSIGGFHNLPLAVLVYFPHGSLEILAYFIGAIAGGLVSAAFARKGSRLFMPIVKDSLMLVGIAIVILVVAGVIEATSIVISG